MRRIIVLLGPPGVGKGTAAVALVNSFSFGWLSSGELLRSVKQSGSELGSTIAGFIDNGRLVPDQLIIDLVEKEILRSPDDCYLLLDGFPRTLPQAASLEEMLGKHGDQVGLVIELTADLEEIERRILSRKAVEGRADDTLSTLRHRLEVYQRQTAPLVDFYEARKKLHRVSGMGSPAEVVGRISQAIQNALKIEPISQKKEAC